MAAAGSGLLAGAGAGRSVLFLHGYAQDAAVFRGRAGRWRSGRRDTPRRAHTFSMQ